MCVAGGADWVGFEAVLATREKLRRRWLKVPARHSRGARAQDPSIREIASQISMDPSFRQMASTLAAGAPAGGAAAAAPPALDPSAYMNAMQGMMTNPEFLQMAERLGTQMMRDPAVSSMLSQMSNPGYASDMKAKMDELKNDPELAAIMAEIETGGPAAMVKYWNDPSVLAKLGRAMGGDGALAALGGGMGGYGALTEVGETDGEEEDEDEEELTLHSAASTGDHESLAVLLKQPGVAVNAADGEGRTALHFACGYGELQCVEALLDARAEVDAVDKNANTALHYAAGYGKVEVVRLLVDAGASVVLKNADGKSPLDVARLNSQEDVLACLEKDVFL